MFIDSISPKYDENNTYNTELVSYVQIKKDLTQFKLAELLNEKSKGTVTQSSVSRWKSYKNYFPPEQMIELVKIAGLDWDIEEFVKKRTFQLRKTVSWRIIISNKKNEEKWFNFCAEYSQELEDAISPVDFVLMINHLGFNFDSDFDNFIKNEFYLDLFKQWIRRFQELIVWFKEIIPLNNKGIKNFRNNYLWQVAFIQVIKDQDPDMATKYVNPYDLYYEIEAISQRSYIFHRSLVFINRTEMLGLSESKLDDILIDNRLLVGNGKDLNKSGSLKEDGVAVDVSQWSKAEQEIYKQLSKIKTELLEKIDK